MVHATEFSSMTDNCVCFTLSLSLSVSLFLVSSFVSMILYRGDEAKQGDSKRGKRRFIYGK